jgi:uncharacterized membrane protein YqhA
MLYTVFSKARYLTIASVLGLLIASASLFVMGGRMIVHQFLLTFTSHTEKIVEILPTFEVEMLQGINLMLVGTGCLSLSLGMFSLFLRPLQLPPSFRVDNFHELKSQFANYIILAMAIIFLENLTHLPEMISTPTSTGSELFFAGAGVTLITFALLAFKYWGGDNVKAPNARD